MKPRVLIVDGDSAAVASCLEQLQDRFDVERAKHGASALTAIAQAAPFAVIVTEMRLTDMPGAKLLARVANLSPETTRIALTRFVTAEIAVRAINEGRVHSFLQKPCSPESLVKAIDLGVREYQSTISEQAATSNLLAGAIKLLVDTLTMANPAAIEKSSRVRDYVTAICDELKTENKWDCEIAALLSRLGYIGIADDLRGKARRGDWLSTDESQQLQSIPRLSYDLIANIPQLRSAAQIVLYQAKQFDGRGFPDDDFRGEDIPTGARILKAAIDYESFVADGGAPEVVLSELRSRKGEHDPQVIDALEKAVVADDSQAKRKVMVDDLKSATQLNQFA